MAMQQYKCPCCGGAIEFNSQVQKMKCPFCDTEFEMETLTQYDQALSEDGQDNMDWSLADSQQWMAADDPNMRVYHCQSCGGEVIADANMAASSCPYCDNTVIIMNQLTGDLKPELVIPFKLDKEAAKAKFSEHLKGKKLLPKVFKTENHIDEIKGIYVPYWLFNSEADADLHYKATRLRHWRSGDREYTETSYYSVSRSGKVNFRNVPVDGSSRMEDKLMESLEPYDMRAAVPFQSAYLAGYMADRYDVDMNACVGRANQRVKNSTYDAFRRTVQGYTTVTYDGGRIRLNGGQTKYAMYPVWILNTTWNGKRYRFAMNGQTGKFVGDLPSDKGLVKKHFFKTFGIAGVLVFAVEALIWFSRMGGL